MRSLVNSAGVDLVLVASREGRSLHKRLLSLHRARRAITTTVRWRLEYVWTTRWYSRMELAGDITPELGVSRQKHHINNMTQN